jgi:hypothetical protein
MKLKLVLRQESTVRPQTFRENLSAQRKFKSSEFVVGALFVAAKTRSSKLSGDRAALLAYKS